MNLRMAAQSSMEPHNQEWRKREFSLASFSHLSREDQRKKRPTLGRHRRRIALVYVVRPAADAKQPMLGSLSVEQLTTSNADGEQEQRFGLVMIVSYACMAASD